MFKCAHPWYSKKQNMMLPCGKCLPCIKKRQAEWSMRMSHEAKTYEKRGFGTSFITLTYNDKYLPRARENENIVDFEPELRKIKRRFVDSDYGTLVKSDLQKFKKRLRNYAWRHLDKRKIKFSEEAEYGPRGTRRPHYHLICYGMSLTDLVPSNIFMKNSKGYGMRSSYLVEKMWSGDVSVGRYSSKRIARKGYRSKSLISQFQKHKQLSVSEHEPGANLGLNEEQFRGVCEDYSPYWSQMSPVAQEGYVNFSVYQVKSVDEGFYSKGFNVTYGVNPEDDKTFKYVANYAQKTIFDKQLWPNRIKVRKCEDGEYRDDINNVITPQMKERRNYDNYGRYRPYVRHSRGLGVDWALAHADELRRDLGVMYTYLPKDIFGKELSPVPVVAYAPLPRAYKNALEIDSDDYKPKIKEMMQKAFDKYKQLTGRDAILPEWTKYGKTYLHTDQKDDDFYIRQKPPEPMVFVERRMHSLDPEITMPGEAQLSKYPVWSEHFPGMRIQPEFFEWQIAFNKTKESGQQFWMRQNKTKESAFCA